MHDYHIYILPILNADGELVGKQLIMTRERRVTVNIVSVSIFIAGRRSVVVNSVGVGEGRVSHSPSCNFFGFVDVARRLYEGE